MIPDPRAKTPDAPPFTEEHAEIISDASWQMGGEERYAGRGIRIELVHAYSVTHKAYSGEIDVDGEPVEFAVTIDLEGGFDLDSWGFVEDFDPPEPRTFVPIHGAESFQIMEWARARVDPDSATSRLAHEALYDLHFAPGLKTRGHYGPRLAAHNVRLGLDSELDAEARSCLDFQRHVRAADEAKARGDRKAMRAELDAADAVRRAWIERCDTVRKAWIAWGAS